MQRQSITQLIIEEQARQAGRLVVDVELDKYIERLFNQAEISVHYEGQSCRGLVAFYCNQLASGRAYITLIVVAPAFRGQGIASALLAYVNATARARGFSRIELEVNKYNVPAILFYRNAGFTIAADQGNKYLLELQLS